ncbi:MAG: DUF512 domain-containing protein [Coriobacteriia bacterium]|nr:DUF512 domain-containing protein [Coriobacteriia bacterium]
METRQNNCYAQAQVPATSRAFVSSITTDSPADQAGLKPGMIVINVNGKVLRDIIDWLWLSDGCQLELEIVRAAGGSTAATDTSSADTETAEVATSVSAATAAPEHFSLRRTLSEPWGIEFEQPLFDGMRTCVNSCSFCFLNMLPEGLRSALYQRDDDFRLSFLQGNFVTLSNLDQTDINRIIAQRLSPLNVSLHAVQPEVRSGLIGSNAQVSFDNLEALLAAGIEFHTQIVLVPGVNDGNILAETLAWIARHPQILSTGIVPYAYTRYAEQQSSHTPAQAEQLIDWLLPLAPQVQLADDWFLLARRELPGLEYYGDFPQYENGIGMVRSFISEWLAILDTIMQAAETDDTVSQTSSHTPAATHLILLTGTAFAPILEQLVAGSPHAHQLSVLPVANQFFSGCVNVTGLLTGADIIDALNSLDNAPSNQKKRVLIPSVIFNSDELTLDGYTLQQLQEAVSYKLHVVTY